MVESEKMHKIRPIDMNSYFFLFLNKNICCGDSKEPSQRDGSYERAKQMLYIYDLQFYAQYFRLSRQKLCLKLEHFASTGSALFDKLKIMFLNINTLPCLDFHRDGSYKYPKHTLSSKLIN